MSRGNNPYSDGESGYVAWFRGYDEGFEDGKQRGFMEGFHAGLKRAAEMMEGCAYGGDHKEERAE